jgi:hypothetical protein
MGKKEGGIRMCKFWSCILTKEMKVLWDKDNSSHDNLISSAKLKDDKLENRTFVRIEVSPKTDIGIFSKKRSVWTLKVDEEGTLPLWFSASRKTCEARVWKEWENAMKKTLWKLELEKAEKFIEEVKKIKYFDFHGEIKKEWNVSFGKNLIEAESAAWSAAGSAARSVAGSSAGSAAESAAWSMAGSSAESAAVSVAVSVAVSAARSSAESAGRSAAWSMARSVAGLAACILVGTRIEAKHRLHIESEMDVWRAGYGLVCDVNGKLFVYAVKKEG